MLYDLHGASDDDYMTVYATHAALPGTYVMYVFYDGETTKSPVIMWGVLKDASPVPITLDGVWDGTTHQENKCVLFPDGRCAAFEANWDSEVDAITDLKGKAPK